MSNEVEGSLRGGGERRTFQSKLFFRRQMFEFKICFAPQAELS